MCAWTHRPLLKHARAPPPPWLLIRAHEAFTPPPLSPSPPPTLFNPSRVRRRSARASEGIQHLPNPLLSRPFFPPPFRPFSLAQALPCRPSPSRPSSQTSKRQACPSPTPKRSSSNSSRRDGTKASSGGRLERSSRLLLARSVLFVLSARHARDGTLTGSPGGLRSLPISCRR